MIPPDLLFNLFLAVSVVESGVNPDAIGDQGRAIGIVQIHKILVDDVNRIGHYNLLPEDRNKVGYSWLMFRVYMEHYGRGLDRQEDLARLWNGGPKGLNKPATIKYGKTVAEILENTYVMTAARERVANELLKEIQP